MFTFLEIFIGLKNGSLLHAQTGSLGMQCVYVYIDTQQDPFRTSCQGCRNADQVPNRHTGAADKKKKKEEELGGAGDENKLENSNGVMNWIKCE